MRASTWRLGRVVGVVPRRQWLNLLAGANERLRAEQRTSMIPAQLVVDTVLALATVEDLYTEFERFEESPLSDAQGAALRPSPRGCGRLRGVRRQRPVCVGTSLMPRRLS